ncbi:MAG: NADH-quinone oxidoreductase subunit N, partial [Candidatus Eremiobacteraeota bacterium]|nr:NADH-quinone oxidoreductase subunit N [Candidatus Eremiobacteraeota bacterium]
GLMSVAVKVPTFALLARVVYVVLGPDSAALIPLYVLALFSMLVGNLGAIRQRNLKRLLAYSSIAQAGYIVIALAGAHAGGLSAMLFYLAAYAFTNLGAFGVIALLGDGDEAYADLDAFRGLFFRRPWAAAAMALFFFSLAGIPATAGFYAKILLLQQAFTAGPWGIALALGLVLGTLISFYVYGKIVWTMYSPVEVDAAEGAGNAFASWVAIGAGAVATVLLGVLPQLFYTSQPFLSAAAR